MSGISRSGERELELRAALGHVAELHRAREDRLAAAAKDVDLRFDFVAFSLAGALLRVFRAARLRLCRAPPAGSGCTATAVSPSIVSGRVVAIVTCVGSPGLRIDHRILEVPEVALYGFVKHFIIADGRLQERVPVHQPLAAVDFAVLEQAEEPLADGAAHIGRRA